MTNTTNNTNTAPSFADILRAERDELAAATRERREDGRRIRFDAGPTAFAVAAA